MTGAVNRRMFVTPLTVNAGQIGAISPVLDNANLETVRIVIPDGHNGLTALQILSGGTPLFPYGADPFIRGNNEVIDFAWDDEITKNGLQCIGFNADIYPHTWTIRWTLTDLVTSSPVVIASPQAAAPVSQDTANEVGALALSVPDAQLAAADTSLDAADAAAGGLGG